MISFKDISATWNKLGAIKTLVIVLGAGYWGIYTVHKDVNRIYSTMDRVDKLESQYLKDTAEVRGMMRLHNADIELNVNARKRLRELELSIKELNESQSEDSAHIDMLWTWIDYINQNREK